MDFNKNNLGLMATLILVILLSQSKFFNFLTDTAAGRAVLLAFVIYISYIHKMMGLVAVLFIIIAFDFNGTNTVHSYNFYEGFDMPSANAATTDKKPDDKKVIEAKKAKELQDSLKAATKAASDLTTSSSSVVAGREGFNMSDKEINMLRGKQSNAIPVHNREQNDDVSPSDKSVFTDSYASF